MKKEHYYIDQLPKVGDVHAEFMRRKLEVTANNYVIYCRESDESQDRNQSIPDQVELCQKLAESLEVNVLCVVEEKRSARQFNRPRFLNLIRAIKGEEELEGLTREQKKMGRPDGIIAWDPSRLARNMRDAGEIIELLDDERLRDMKFVAYSFHNDSSGMEHLAMEFARAKGYSDHLTVYVLRGNMRAELQGKGAKNLPPAFDKLRKEDEDDPEHLKIIKSKLHEFWRSAYIWKLEGISNKEIARKLVEEQGYEDWWEYTKKIGNKKVKKRQKVNVDDAYIGKHLSNPLHCGLLIPERSKIKRVMDLNEVYPRLFGEEDFPIVVTMKDFQSLYPEKFSDTATKPPTAARRRTDRPLSGKVLCKKQHELGALATMFYSPNKGGTKKPSHRFACERCEKYHSININEVFDAVEQELAKIKLTEKEHKKFVVTEWVKFEQERAQIRQAKMQLTKMREENKIQVEDSEALVRHMKHSPDSKATPEEIKKEEKRLAMLHEQMEAMAQQEVKLVQESIDRYYDLDAFLELSKYGSTYWKKANEKIKREIGDLTILNVIIDEEGKAKVSLAEPFAGWAKDRKEAKNGDGGQYWT